MNVSPLSIPFADVTNVQNNENSIQMNLAMRTNIRWYKNTK